MRYTRWIPAYLLALGLACSSDSGTNPDPQQQGSIQLTITPTSATIQQGGSTSVTGTIVRTNFTGDIGISISGQPTGVTGSVTTAPVGGSNSLQVTISASSSAPVGSYPIKVIGSGAGIASDDATFTLIIAAATPASFSMAMANVATVAQGASTPRIVDFTRTNFTGNITLAAENLPTGVTASFAPHPVAGIQSTLTLSATPSAAPGTFTGILVRATAAGLTDVTLPLSITVTVTGNFAIAASNSTLNVVRGSGANTAITTTRTGGFVGAIAYTVSGPANAALPTGLTASVAPTAMQDQHTLTIATTTALAGGTYPVVVHATTAGLPEQTASVNVTVTVPPAGATVRLDYSLCNSAQKPTWMAYQDGDGPWIRVNGVDDFFTFDVVQDKAAVATVLSQQITEVKYFTRAEAAMQGSTVTTFCTVIPSGKTVNASATGIFVGFTTTVSLGERSILFGNQVGTFNFQLTGVNTGLQTMIAYRRRSDAPGSFDDRYIIRPNQDIPNGGSLALLDFIGGEAQVPTTTFIGVTGGAPSDQLSHSLALLMGPGCTVPALPMYSKSDVGQQLYVYGLQPVHIPSTAFYLLKATNVAGGTTRTIERTSKTLVNENIALGASIMPVVTVPNTAQEYRLLQSAVPLGNDYASARLNYFDNAGKTFIVERTAGHIAGAASATLTAPDLSGVSGYQPQWAPSKLSAITYTTTATSSGATSVCTDGRVVRGIAVNGNIPQG